MSHRMRAVIFHGPRQIRLEDVARPSVGPGQVLLKVGAALTCGTDFKAYRQGHKVLLGDPPSPFGHELSGTVVDVGDGVTTVRTGDRVVAANSAPCLARCYFCARGQNQLCENLKLHNGAYAEYNLVPGHIARHNLWKLPQTLPFPSAALAEPLACAVHGVDAVGCAEGETVAVLGAGPMALLLIQTLRARNCRVLVAGRSYENLETAKKAGAHETFSSLDEDIGAAVRKVTEGRGADAVFEAVGRPETWQQSLSMVRKGGRVCLFGGCASGTVVPIDAHRVHYEQLTLHGVFHHTPKYFKAAVDLLAAGKVAVDLLVRESIGLSDVPAFFAANADRSIPKAAVIP
jgi:L-iditol 2-dehydrogenase